MSQHHRAHTLLELVVATAIVAATLVPALKYLRSGMILSQEISSRNMMSIYAASKLDEHLAISAASWVTGTTTGDFSTDGNANIRFSVVCSDDSSDGGIIGKLMSVTATLYDDENGNDVMDISEPQLIYRSKIAKIATYENEAGS